MPLPDILAGPIVRKATYGYVYVWIATSRELVNPEIKLFLKKEWRGKKENLDAISRSSSAVFGRVVCSDRFYIYLLRAIPSSSEGFPTDEVLGYDIVEYVKDHGEIKESKSILSQKTRRRITLDRFLREGFEFPTIIIQGDKNKLRALYGSCRKLGGPDEDMMIAAYDIINEARNEDRPTTLFLTGDQIYADDVPSSLIVPISALGHHLMGFALDKDTSKLTSSSAIGIRGKNLDKLVKDRQGNRIFTSDEKDNHLITFGEFAAAYLLSWNLEMWWFLSINLKNRIHKLASEGARYARKVLANVITYMIFDDHEVTDDWFFDSTWKERANQNELSKHIIVNGMAAYLLFQGLGNNPEEIIPQKRETLRAIENYFGYPHKEFQSYLKEVWDFDKWSYIAPTIPPTLVLDTRTKRTSPAPSKAGTPQEKITDSRLFDENEKNRLKRMLSSGIFDKSNPQALILIAPSPMFNLGLMEDALELLEHLGRKAAIWKDAEGWINYKLSMVDVFEIASQFNLKPLIIISGDIHFGFEMIGKATMNNIKTPFLQLCSSAMKNHPLGQEYELMNGINTDKLRLVALGVLAGAGVPSHLAYEIAKGLDPNYLTRERQTPYSFYYIDGKVRKVSKNISEIDTPGNLLATTLSKRKEALRISNRFNERGCRNCPPGAGPIVSVVNNIGEMVVEKDYRILNRFHFINQKGYPRTKASDFSVWEMGRWPIVEL